MLVTRTPRVRVRGLHEPHGVLLRDADFPPYRQIDQCARKNDIATAPEFPAKRHICTIQHEFRALHRGVALVYQTAHKKANPVNTAVGL